jgi:hypothetical protein
MPLNNIDKAAMMSSLRSGESSDDIIQPHFVSKSPSSPSKSPVSSIPLNTEAMIKSELNDYQIQHLEQSFSLYHYPNKATVKELAQALKLTEPAIEVI